MKQISLSEVANITGITKSKIKYWASLLNIEIKKQNRILFLPLGSETILLAMSKLIASGLSPASATKEVLSVHPLPTIQEEKKDIDTNKLTDRISSLEQAVMLLVEQNKSLATTVENQNRFIVSSLQAQNNHLKTIQLKLDPPRPSKQIEVWKPSKPQRPKYSTIQRIWYEVTNPEKLRAN